MTARNVRIEEERTVRNNCSSKLGISPSLFVLHFFVTPSCILFFVPLSFVFQLLFELSHNMSNIQNISDVRRHEYGSIQSSEYGGKRSSSGMQHSHPFMSLIHISSCLCSFSVSTSFSSCPFLLCEGSTLP